MHRGRNNYTEKEYICENMLSFQMHYYRSHIPYFCSNDTALSVPSIKQIGNELDISILKVHLKHSLPLSLSSAGHGWTNGDPFLRSLKGNFAISTYRLRRLFSFIKYNQKGPYIPVLIVTALNIACNGGINISWLHKHYVPLPSLLFPMYSKYIFRTTTRPPNGIDITTRR